MGGINVRSILVSRDCIQYRGHMFISPLTLSYWPGMKIAVAAGVAARRQTATKRAIRSVAGIRSGVAVRFEKIAKKI